MNNKRWGTQWEKEFCNLLAAQGFWVHFITPDNRGAQPFDVIAARGGTAYAFDCKTCADNWFNITRLEDNQVMAFEKWLRCGNTEPTIAVLHKDNIYLIGYKELKENRRIRLNDDGSTSVHADN
jgi:Holliday junction resolvase